MLAELLDDDLLKDYERLPDYDRIAIMSHLEWIGGAHKHQVPPPLESDWTVWMLLAGRGAGKTRCAAEALWCPQNPKTPISQMRYQVKSQIIRQ